MANDLNQCNFIGRCGGDPETRQAGSATVCSFSIAVGSTWTDKTSGQKQERTEWVRVAAWGKLGEICQKYLTKGKQVFISGELRTEKFADKTTGQDRYSTQIIANNMQLLGSPDNARNQSNQAAGGVPAYAGKQPAEDFEDSDMPF